MGHEFFIPNSNFLISCHFLRGLLDRNRLRVRAIAELSPGDQLTDIPRWDPAGAPVGGPIDVPLADA